MYALDTNTVIYFFKNNGHVAEHLFSLPPHEIALPAVVLYELEVGIAKSTAPEKRRAQLKELLTVVRVLPFTENEAAAFLIKEIRCFISQIIIQRLPLCKYHLEFRKIVFEIKII